jgi:hypothetical protein
MKIAVKYCGSCNSETDLAQIGRSLTAQVQQYGWQLSILDVDAEVDVLVLLCGCLRACVGKEDQRRQAKQVVRVAGKHLGWLPLKESELPQAVIEAI